MPLHSTSLLIHNSINTYKSQFWVISLCCVIYISCEITSFAYCKSPLHTSATTCNRIYDNFWDYISTRGWWARVCITWWEYITVTFVSTLSSYTQAIWWNSKIVGSISLANCKNAVSPLRMEIVPSCIKLSIWCVMHMPEFYNNNPIDRIYMCIFGKVECKNENIKHLAHADFNNDRICNLIFVTWQISNCIKSLLDF